MSLMQCDAGPQPRAKAKWRGNGTRGKKLFSAYSIRDILASTGQKRSSRRTALTGRLRPGNLHELHLLSCGKLKL